VDTYWKNRSFFDAHHLVKNVLGPLAVRFPRLSNPAPATRNSVWPSLLRSVADRIDMSTPKSGLDPGLGVEVPLCPLHINNFFLDRRME